MDLRFVAQSREDILLVAVSVNVASAVQIMLAA
jgi:hypothetical protein